MTNSLDLSVVIPCFNENPHIEAILTDWLEELRYRKLAFELVIINDGSLDGTGRVLDKLRKEHTEIRVIHQLNMGNVRACRRGYETARGRYILSISANGRCEPSDFALLWDKKGAHELILGQRTHRLDGWMSRHFTRFLSVLAYRLFSIRLVEPGIPFRLFLRKPALNLMPMIPMEWESFHWAMTILFALQSPQPVLEVQVPYRHRLERKSPFHRTGLIRLSWTYFLESLRLKFKVLRSKGFATALVPQTQL